MPPYFGPKVVFRKDHVRLVARKFSGCPLPMVETEVQRTNSMGEKVWVPPRGADAIAAAAVIIPHLVKAAGLIPEEGES